MIRFKAKDKRSSIKDIKVQVICLALLISFFSCTENEKNFEHVKLNIYRNTSNNSLVYQTFSDSTGSYYHPIPQNLNVETAMDYKEWLIDDKTVFAWYDTNDGRYLVELKNVDRASFIVMDSSIYAKDKNHIYDTRHGIIKNADLETFEVVNINAEGRLAYAKDKNNYFFWDQVVTDTLGFNKALSE